MLLDFQVLDNLYGSAIALHLCWQDQYQLENALALLAENYVIAEF